MLAPQAVGRKGIPGAIRTAPLVCTSIIDAFAWQADGRPRLIGAPAPGKKRPRSSNSPISESGRNSRAIVPPRSRIRRSRSARRRSSAKAARFCSRRITPLSGSRGGKIRRSFGAVGPARRRVELLHGAVRARLTNRSRRAPQGLPAESFRHPGHSESSSTATGRGGSFEHADSAHRESAAPGRTSWRGTASRALDPRAHDLIAEVLTRRFGGRPRDCDGRFPARRPPARRRPTRLPCGCAIPLHGYRPHRSADG
jgi:hypothetical protein